MSPRALQQDPAGRWLQEPSEDAERSTGSQPLCLAVEHDVLPGSSQSLLTLLSSVDLCSGMTRMRVLASHELGSSVGSVSCFSR